MLPLKKKKFAVIELSEKKNPPHQRSESKVEVWCWSVQPTVVNVTKLNRGIRNVLFKYKFILHVHRLRFYKG